MLILTRPAYWISLPITIGDLRDMTDDMEQSGMSKPDRERLYAIINECVKGDVK